MTDQLARVGNIARVGQNASECATDARNESLRCGNLPPVDWGGRRASESVSFATGLDVS